MATIYIPHGTGRQTAEVHEGGTAVPLLKKEGVLGQAARNGLERQTSSGAWEKVSLAYIVQRGDTLRVCYPSQKSGGDALGGVLQTIFSLAKRRKRAGS